PRERRVIAPPKTPTMSEDSVLRNDSAQKEDKRSVRRTPRDTTAGSENVSTPGSDSSSASRKKPDRSANPDMRILPADRVTDGDSSERKAKHKASQPEPSIPSNSGNGAGDNNPHAERHKRAADNQSSNTDNNSSTSTNSTGAGSARRNDDEKRQRNSERPHYD